MESTDFGISAEDISNDLVKLLIESSSLKLKSGSIYKKFKNGKAVKMAILYTITEGKYAGAPIIIDFPFNEVED